MTINEAIKNNPAGAGLTKEERTEQVKAQKKGILIGLAYAVCAAALIWILASYIGVMSGHIGAWNIFTLFLRLTGH